VYATIQKQTELLAADLRSQGFKAEAFHAGMEAAKKAQLQDRFMKSDDLIIVATIAFGMGIDKPNIRNVVHFNIPSSVESYSQEIGRAGRDGSRGTCLFYLCGEDIYLRDVFVRRDLAIRESTRRLLEDIFDPAIVKLPIGAEIRRSLAKQEKDFDIQSTTLRSIYAKLELDYGLFREATATYTNYSFQAGPYYRYKLATDKSPAATAVKLYSKLAESLYHIDARLASMTLKIPRTDIVKKLNDWDESQIISLKVSGVLNTYRTLKPLPKTAAEREKLVDGLYEGMERREQEALHRTDQILHLITGKTCFARSLSEHFGDQLPDSKAECGHCTWCLTHVPVAKYLPEPVPFNWTAFNKIIKAVAARDDARLLARIAFGIKSPRTRTLKLPPRVLGSMDDHEFMVSKFAQS
jgi:Helicase conserved C-terminal domain/RecQ zinc-binding